jgi:hypothetical protein
MPTKLQEFSKYWGRETIGTLALMRALPTNQYDFRPDPGGRSIVSVRPSTRLTAVREG